MCKTEPRHQKNGSSLQRLRDVLNKTCPCGKDCFQNFQQVESDAFEFVKQFWALKKLQQDMYVQYLAVSNKKIQEGLRGLVGCVNVSVGVWKLVPVV